MKSNRGRKNYFQGFGFVKNYLPGVFKIIFPGKESKNILYRNNLDQKFNIKPSEWTTDCGVVGSGYHYCTTSFN